MTQTEAKLKAAIRELYRDKKHPVVIKLIINRCHEEVAEDFK